MTPLDDPDPSRWHPGDRVRLADPACWGLDPSPARPAEVRYLSAGKTFVIYWTGEYDRHAADRSGFTVVSVEPQRVTVRGADGFLYSCHPLWLEAAEPPQCTCDSLALAARGCRGECRNPPARRAP